jgi:hypothetical protein
LPTEWIEWGRDAYAGTILAALETHGFQVVNKDALENLKAIAAKGTQHSVYVAALKFLDAASGENTGE